ncbi:MAG: undecaprenyl-diphosphate phosphatase [Acidimicrobiia bacterium]|nr:undecaprenyl-diphosphate phosphatase [Acidimicrobiia bacterium]
MFTAAFWGLVQGLTEFLPISSSGHLVLVPALLDMEEPDLATSAVLHLGTLAAVIWYYRGDLVKLLRFRSDPDARRVAWLLAIGTIPAGIAGLTLEGPLEDAFAEPWIAAAALIVTGLVLAASTLVPVGSRCLEEGRWHDAVVVGVAQALALVPGISRSGMTITAGLTRGLDRLESARYAFLLAVPSIAGAGLLETLDLADAGGLEASVLVGVAVAALSGYLAIAGLVRLLASRGLAPFAVYCVGFGTVAWILV